MHPDDKARWDEFYSKTDGTYDALRRAVKEEYDEQERLRAERFTQFQYEVDQLKRERARAETEAARREEAEAIESIKDSIANRSNVR